MTADSNALGALHAKLAEEFTKRLLGGDLSAAELNVIRQFLKDNNISAALVPGTPLKNLLDEMEDLTPEERQFLAAQGTK